MTWKQYWYENDIDMINNAIVTAKLGEKTVTVDKNEISVNDWIFEKEYKRIEPEPFALY